VSQHPAISTSPAETPQHEPLVAGPTAGPPPTGRPRADAGPRPTRLRRLLTPFAAFRRLPRAARLCALLACINAVCWSVITPPFEAPDEPAHFAYVQQLAETSHLPSSNEGPYSASEEGAMRAVLIGEVLWHPEHHTISNKLQERQLQELLAEPLANTDNGNAGVASSEPPLYYALQVIPYDIGKSDSVLGSLALMRLLSTIMAAFTALFTYLFVREALPGVPWAWTVGGLSVALAPLLGFMSGVVNPDSMLYAVSAAIFFCLARGFRRGLTPRLAIALGALVTVGLLTKVNFVGLIPGIGVGALVLFIRALRERPHPRSFYAALALAVAIPVTPVGVYILVNVLSGKAGLGLVSSAISLTTGRESLIGELRYIWEFYLPRIPGMKNEFGGLTTTRDIWFNRSVGLYGWLDTSFAPWVDDVALILVTLIALLGIRSLLARRRALRRRVAELLVYATVALGLMALLGSDSYLHKSIEGAGWAQPRYLMPLVPLVAIAVALAARGAGRRWGPVVGTLIVTLVLAQDIFSQLQTVARFYG
jgi:hypothetical protein